MVPPQVAVPRGALIWSQLVGAAARWLAPRPRTPQEEAALEAARVRAMADHYRYTDPGFAADLQAAASRYEQAFEDAAGSLKRAKR